MAVRGTIVVEFGESVSDSSFTVVEFDDVINQTAQGEVYTTFLPSEEAAFIVHFDPTKLRIDRVGNSDGSIRGGNTVSRSKTQQLQFINTEDDSTLSYIPSSSPSIAWYGNSPGTSRDERKVRASGAAVPAIGDFTFNIFAVSYILSPPAGLTLGEDETYPVLAVVYMEAAT